MTSTDAAGIRGSGFGIRQVKLAERYARTEMIAMNARAKSIAGVALLASLLTNASVAGASPQTQAQPGALSGLSSRDLLAAFTDSNVTAHIAGKASAVDPDAALAELVRRRAVQDLFNAFSHPSDDVQQWWVSRALGEIGGRDVGRRMKAYASTRTTLTAFLALRYLANEGDRAALGILNRNYFKYPVSSLEWSEAVRLFGKYHFKAAASNLVASLDAASLNLAGAAEQSLGELFPNDRKELNSPEEAQRYWADVVAKDSKNDPRK